MQEHDALRHGSDGFADRIGDLEKQFEKLDAAIARQSSSAHQALKKGEPSVIAIEHPLTYLWLPGGGILVARMW